VAIMQGLFITGTGTEVGKTYVACRIAESLVAQGLQVGVYKPAASGCRVVEGRVVSDDAVALWHSAGKPGRLEDVCPQIFLAAVAPHVAARREGRTVDEDLLRRGLAAWTSRSDFILVEGAGGLMSPISDHDYVADLAHEFGFPLVVVAANELGVINATLQTLVTAGHYRGGTKVAAVVLNDARRRPEDESSSSNFQELSRRVCGPAMTRLSHEGAEFEPPVDWSSLASVAPQ
jgi:dethiobiotin synthetase